MVRTAACMALVAFALPATPFALQSTPRTTVVAQMRSPAPICSSVELTRPPFSSDVIDSNTGQPVKIDPRNDAWLPIPVTKTKSEQLPVGALRFVVEGNGKLVAGGEEFDVEPDMMVEVTAEGVELVWTGELMLLSPDFWMPERILARNAAPFVFGAVGVVIIGSQIFDAVTGA